jgi:hypothetical protein
VKHGNAFVRELLDVCPGMEGHLELDQGPHYLFCRLGMLLRDGTLTPGDETAAWALINRMAEGDIEAQELIAVDTLEMLLKTPESIALARKYLSNGAQAMFDEVIRFWLPTGNPA